MRVSDHKKKGKGMKIGLVDGETEFFTILMITKTARKIIFKIKERKVEKDVMMLKGKEKFRRDLLAWWNSLNSEREKKNEEKN